MHLSSAIASVALLASTCSAASSCWVPSDTSGSDKLAADSLKKLTRAINAGCLKSHVESKGVPQACTLKNAAVRKEYSTLTTAEKLDYTRAVKCLMAKPSIGHPDVTPGAKSRYDDFVATHINQTRSIHQSGYFLSWHRHYVYVWEKALREECGYKGWQPYWNWGKSTEDVLNSPYFDGSETSQAANGDYEAHNCTRGLPSNLLCIEPGVGGGCVTTGPYANMKANLTATVPTWPGVKAKTPFSYDPRCIRHDISDKLSKTWSGDEHSVDLLTNPLYQTGVSAFQDRLAYVGTSTVGHYGLHQVGHFITNGDPSGDFFNSPNDPIFWLHHAQVDRTWWIWQNQKPVTRNFQIAGTRTMGNNPPSDNATIEDTFDMGYNGGRVAVKELLSTVAGPYCYIYL